MYVFSGSLDGLQWSVSDLSGTDMGRWLGCLGCTGENCVYDEQLTQNWSGQGESDCLIKTKHCEGRRRC